jgi:hypothetical protein
MEEGLDALLRLSSGLDMEKPNALQQASVCDMIPLALTKYQEEASIIEVLFGSHSRAKPVEGSTMICAQVLDRMQAMIDCIEHAGGRYASGNGMSCY